MRNSLLAAINRAQHAMGNEQRKYGRELHTNEFDVVPKCQHGFCKRLVY
jgi:hypothetical protein